MTQTKASEKLNPFELDKRFRDVLSRATPETCLSCAQELVGLGVGAPQALLIVLKVLEDR